MNKKIKIILLILVIPFLLFIFSYSNTNNTDNSASEIYESVYVNVIFEGKDPETYTSISSNEISLEEILDRMMMRSSFRYTKETSDMGSYITGINGVLADPNSEYFNIKINGEDATTGISEIDPEDKDVIDITLTKF